MVTKMHLGKCWTVAITHNKAVALGDIVRHSLNYLQVLSLQQITHNTMTAREPATSITIYRALRASIIFILHIYTIYLNKKDVPSKGSTKEAYYNNDAVSDHSVHHVECSHVVWFFSFVPFQVPLHGLRGYSPLLIIVRSADKMKKLLTVEALKIF